MRYVLLACLLCTFHSWAQDSTKVRRWSVIYKPLGSVSPALANHTFGVQYEISESFIAEVDVGLIKTWYDLHLFSDKDASSTGFKLSAELKFILVDGLYVALQGFYNDYTKESEEYVWRFGETYQEKMDIEKFITSWGVHTKAGYLLKRPNKKFFFDFYVGIGFRQKIIEASDLPDDVTLENESNASPADEIPGTYIYPSVSLGAAVGYTF